jgi:peptidoglycan/xylan/chitin deacetylase (PgdA/CDA1 family)
MPAVAIFACALLLFAHTAAAQQAPCPGNPEALGTARVLDVDVTTTPRIGRKQFPVTLLLQPGEFVLTFDDGPWPTTTPRVLATLRHECVKATFFLVGRQADAAPALVRATFADGHSIGTHSYSHPLLSKMPLPQAEDQIDHGIAAANRALTDRGQAAPFFRFPGFASSPALLDRLQQRGIVVFGADLWASDWLPMSPDQELALVMRRVHATGRGILLLHDTKAQTAAMLPSLLRTLKQQGYRIVHVVPSGRRPALSNVPANK